MNDIYTWLLNKDFGWYELDNDLDDFCGEPHE